MSNQTNSKIFRQEATFIAGAMLPKQLPKSHLPQIAFVGKSNVGKSNLINALCNRKSLARVSHTPGRTQQINFFNVGDSFILADLPGYGFAKVSHNIRRHWEKLIVAYLENEAKIILVNVLIDARRGIKQHDLDVIMMLKSLGHKFQIILTKADKQKIDDVYLAELKKSLIRIDDTIEVFSTSSKSGLGIGELKNNIAYNLDNSSV